MNLKLRRLVRTPYSEQFALFDLDQTDASYDPMSIGKLDLHYTADAIEFFAPNLNTYALHSNEEEDADAAAEN